MNNSREHIITRVLVSLNYNGDQEKAAPFLHNLSDLVEAGLEAAGRKADGYTFLHKTDVKAERVELDLGEISESYFKYEFRKELEARFGEWLDNLNGGRDLPPGVEVTFRETSLAGLLEIMLKTGQLPWWADNPASLTLASIFTELAAEQPGVLISLLKKIGGDRTVRRRLALRLDEPHLENLMKLLQPADAEFILEYVEKTVRVNTKKPIGRLPEKDFRPLIWDFVLEYLLTNQTTRFNRKEFVRWNLQRISRHHNRTFDDVLHIFASEARKLKTVFAAGDSLPVLLAELHSEYQARKTKSPAEENNSAQTVKEVLEGRAFGSSSHLSKILSLAWKQALETEADTLRETLLFSGRKERVRKRMVRLMKDNQLAEAVTLVEPENSSFIQDQPGRAAKLKKKYPGLTASQEELKKAGWEFILAYLFEDRGTAFNQKQFLKSLLEQISAHYNLNIIRVLHYFRDISEGEQRGVVPLLDEILQEYESLSASGFEPSGIAAVKDDLARLRIYLHRIKPFRFSADDVSQAVHLFTKLLQTRPEDLARWVNEAGEFRQALLVIWKRLPREQQYRLLTHAAPNKIRGWEEISLELDQALSRSRKMTTEVFPQIIYERFFEFGVLDHASLDDILRRVIPEIAAHQQMTPAALIRDIAGHYQPEQGGHIIRYLESLSPGDFEKTAPAPVKPEAPFRFVLLVEQYLEAPKEATLRQAYALLPVMTREELTAAVLNLHSRDMLGQTLSLFTDFQWHQVIIKMVTKRVAEELFAVAEFFGAILKAAKAKEAEQSALHSLLLLYALDAGRTATPENLFALLAGRFFKQGEKVLTHPKSKSPSFSASESSKELLQKLRKWHLSGKKRDSLQPGESNHTRFPGFIEMAVKIIAGNPSSFRKEDVRLFIPVLLKLLAEGNQTIRNAFLKYARSETTRNYWLDSFPDDIIHQIAALLVPEQTREKIERWARFGAEAVGQKSNRFRLRILLHASVRLHYQLFSPALVQLEVLRETTAGVPSSKQQEFWKQSAEKLLSALERQQPHQYESITKELKTLARDLPNPEPDKQKSLPEETPKEKEEPEQLKTGEAVYTNRAGLVIVAPFLPRLFERLEYTEGKRFKSDDLNYRAAHLLEYIAGGTEHAEEHLLLLHKLLAGISPSTPLPPADELTDLEKKTADDMLEAIISNWEGIGNTSVAGLRESFIIRQGRLLAEDDRWELTVETKAWDLLLDRLPWGINIVKLPWMKQWINVQWR